MQIRVAEEGDLTGVETIYAHYVASSTATFEESTERSTDFAQVFRRVQDLRLPFLVAVDPSTQGKIVGYAYARPYNARSAYRYTVEDSVYVDPQWCGRGLGRQLLNALIEHLRRTSARQIIAAMSIMPGHKEAASATCRVHRSAGFIPCGRLSSVGFKFGGWIDVVYYQLELDHEGAASV